VGSAEKLEGLFQQSQYVAQAWVYGNSQQSCIVTVCVIDPEPAARLGESFGLHGVRSRLFVIVVCYCSFRRFGNVCISVS